jgi:hypothetical protein
MADVIPDAVIPQGFTQLATGFSGEMKKTGCERFME